MPLKRPQGHKRPPQKALRGSVLALGLFTAFGTSLCFVCVFGRLLLVGPSWSLWCFWGLWGLLGLWDFVFFGWLLVYFDGFGRLDAGAKAFGSFRPLFDAFFRCCVYIYIYYYFIFRPFGAFFPGCVVCFGTPFAKGP